MFVRIVGQRALISDLWLCDSLREAPMTSGEGFREQDWAVFRPAERGAMKEDASPAACRAALVARLVDALADRAQQGGVETDSLTVRKLANLRERRRVFAEGCVDATLAMHPEERDEKTLWTVCWDGFERDQERLWTFYEGLYPCWYGALELVAKRLLLGRGFGAGAEEDSKDRTAELFEKVAAEVKEPRMQWMKLAKNVGYQPSDRQVFGLLHRKLINGLNDAARGATKGKRAEPIKSPSVRRKRTVGADRELNIVDGLEMYHRAFRDTDYLVLSHGARARLHTIATTFEKAHRPPPMETGTRLWKAYEHFCINGGSENGWRQVSTGTINPRDGQQRRSDLAKRLKEAVQGLIACDMLDTGLEQDDHDDHE
jgi:hypothetical protein